MSARRELRQQQELIASLQPALHVPQNWNYEVDSPLYKAYITRPTMSAASSTPPSFTRKRKRNNGNSTLM